MLSITVELPLGHNREEITMEQDFGVAFIAFMTEAQRRIEQDYAAFGGGSNCPKIEPMGGPRFIRIVAVDVGSRSAWAFIDKTNGDVLKAAGWKAPAKNFARGNIFDEQHGCGRVRWTGVS